MLLALLFYLTNLQFLMECTGFERNIIAKYLNEINPDYYCFGYIMAYYKAVTVGRMEVINNVGKSLMLWQWLP